MGNGSDRRLVALDGLRGVAAISVVIMHSLVRPFPFGRSYLAVDFFFLLSGFVLARAYELDLRSGALSLRRYAVLRFARLWPMIILGGLVGLGVALVVDPQISLPLWMAFLAELACVPLVLPGVVQVFLLNAPQWSLFFEIFANAFHALLARRLTNAALIAVLLLSFLGLAATQMTFGTMNRGYGFDGFAGGFARVSFSFFAGIGLSRLLANGRRKVPTPGVLILLGALAVILGLPSQPPGLTANAVDLIVVVIIFPLIVAAGASTVADGWRARLAAMLGAASYPLYLIHWPILHLLAPVLSASDIPKWLKIIRWAGVMISLIAGAWAIDRWIDRPARRMLSGGVGKRPASSQR